MRLFSFLSLRFSAIVVVCLLSLKAQADDGITYVKAGTLIDVQTVVLRRNQVITIRGEHVERVDNAMEHVSFVMKGGKTFKQ